MSKPIFVYALLGSLILLTLSFFLPAPYDSLLSSFIIIAFGSYLLLLTRSNRLQFAENSRKKIKLCAWLAIIFAFVVFFARVWDTMNHYHRVDPRGSLPGKSQLETMQRTS